MSKGSEHGSAPAPYFQFNAIFIIESLPGGDIHTGKKLYEDVFPSLTANNKDPLVKYSPVASKAEFLFALESMAACVDARGLYPILHIECHGEDDGLRMSNDDLVSYEEMIPSLRKINGLMKNNLIVTVSACFGIYLSFSIPPTTPVPAWFLLGPNDTVMPEVLLQTYRAFYDSLLRHFCIDEALRAIRAAVPAARGLFKTMHAEVLFMEVFNHYLSEACSEDAIRERVAEHLSAALNMGMPSSMYDQRKAEYLALVRSEEWNRKQFDRVRRVFLHIDSFPENANRFNLTYDDLSSFDLQKGNQ